jgi:hypothetical protein
MVNNKEDVALELLKNAFSMMKDAIQSVKKSQDDLASKIDHMNMELESGIKHRINLSEIEQNQMKQKIQEISKITSKMQIIFYIAGGMFFILSIIDKIQAGPIVAAILGWR